MIQTSAIFRFPKVQVERPLISHVIRECDVEVNILQARITPEEDGHMFAIFRGSRKAVDNAFRYLKKNQVHVILPAKNLVWDEEVCVNCGACVGQCPSSAFQVDPDSRNVVFNHDRCIACELCIPACSYKAVESISDHLKRTGEL